MRFVLLALFLVLVGCDGETPPLADSGVVAADSGVDPTPVCVEATENPTCEGACEGTFFPRCPPDWTPACSDGSARWRIGYPGGVATCIIRQGPPDCGGGGAAPACEAPSRPVCIAPVVLEGRTCSSPMGFFGY